MQFNIYANPTKAKGQPHTEDSGGKSPSAPPAVLARQHHHEFNTKREQYRYTDMEFYLYVYSWENLSYYNYS